jgi:hypothetical protein
MISPRMRLDLSAIRGKNALRGPRYFNTDLTIIKKTTAGERVSLASRTEFCNAFNNVNFELPGNNQAGGVSGGFGQMTGAAGSGVSSVFVEFLL